MPQLILFVVFGVINALVANKKGFSPLIWFLAGGLLGLIVILFLPSAKAVRAEDVDLYMKRKKTGNTVGLIILAVGVALGILLVLALKA